MTPRIVVLIAPSGTGKTTITKEILRRCPDRFGFSVSATTRSPRAGEADGIAYHFLSPDEFTRRVAAADFLEWAEYAGERYGTLRSEVLGVLSSGRHVLLDIEVQGARQVRQAYPHPASVSIFIIPPSPRVLLERLEQRRTESRQAVRARLEIAVQEVAAARDDANQRKLFDHILVNDDLDSTVQRVIALVDQSDAVRHRTTDMVDLLVDFVRQLEAEAHHLKQRMQRST